jgi:16S rRNA (uracil1498-N3)-methyltransferase
VIALNERVINKDRFEKIILTAMKQSNDVYLPKLNKLFPLKEFINIPKRLQLIAHCEETDKKKYKSTLKPRIAPS